MVLEEGENVQTDINFQPKKSSSPKKRWNSNAATILKLTTNQWWPFDRVDGKLLESLHRKRINNMEEALL